jgi:uncharacterized membrane protein YhhN
MPGISPRANRPSSVRVSYTPRHDRKPAPIPHPPRAAPVTGAEVAAAGATAGALAALLAAEHVRSRAGVWIAKPVASTGFVALALARGALETAYGRWVLLALALGWLGDVLLIPKGAKRAFTAGLASFLLGHLAFAVAFAARGQSLAWLAGGLAFVAAAAVPLARWLLPHVPRELALPVRAYLAVISAMVATAAGATGATGEAAILAGGVAFAVSDVAVARERFVARSPWNQLWGLPLYYGAQLLLAATVP